VCYEIKKLYYYANVKNQDLFELILAAPVSLAKKVHFFSLIQLVKPQSVAVSFYQTAIGVENYFLIFIVI
jgi:hypothetical protein